MPTDIIHTPLQAVSRPRPKPGTPTTMNPAAHRIAFYDFDGTLSSSNVVSRYAFYARHLPSRLRAASKFTKLVLSVPLYLGLDFYSRRAFNRYFYRQYMGMRRAWLRELSTLLFEKIVRPTLYPGARSLVEEDRKAGVRPVVISGGLDFALEPVVRYFGFGEMISNRLVFENGVATGEVEVPLVAEAEKVLAMQKLCRGAGARLSEAKAYSDSASDVPMLEAVGMPAAVHPDRRLRRVARERDWPVLDLKRGNRVHQD